MAWRRAGPRLFAAPACALGGLALGSAGTAQMEEQNIPGGVGGGLVLRQVQVVCRHGARTPLTEGLGAKSCKWDDCGDSFKPVSFEVGGIGGGPRPESEMNRGQVETLFPGGCHLGELTRVGQDQALALGWDLRHRYCVQQQLFPARPTADDLYVRSTNVQRTVRTAAGVLTGLLPHGLDGGEAVTIEVARDEDEILYPNVHSCRGVRSLFRAARRAGAAARAQAKTPEREDLESNVRSALPLPTDEEVNFTKVLDVVRSKLAHGKPVPESLVTRGDALPPIQRLATSRLLRLVADVPPEGADGGVRAGEGHTQAVTVRPHDVRLVAGDLLAEILGNITAATGEGEGEGPEAEGRLRQDRVSEPPRRFVLYSGHDLTLMPLLGIFGGIHDLGWPPFCAHIAVELYERATGAAEAAEAGAEAGGAPAGGRWHIRVLFQGRPLEIPGCGGYGEVVPLAVVREALAPYLLRPGDCDDALAPKAASKADKDHQL